jgi:hypothetical protein
MKTTRRFIMNMRNSYVLAFVSTLLACGGASVASPPASVPAASPLDGRSYDVTLEIPGAPAQKDALNFADGRFESTACTSLGFPKWSDYAAHREADATTFHALAKHPSGTTMDWNGSVHGDAVEGTAIRTMNGKSDALTFKGSLHP